MPSMNPKYPDPISPDEIDRLYREVGARPIREFFVSRDPEMQCCILTALTLDREPYKDRHGIARRELIHHLTEVAATTSEGSAFLAEILGINPDYAYGVANGWDDSYDRANYVCEPEAYRAGRAFGEACAHQAFPEEYD